MGETPTEQNDMKIIAVDIESQEFTAQQDNGEITILTGHVIVDFMENVSVLPIDVNLTHTDGLVREVTAREN